MTVAVSRTKAEQALTQQFEAVSAQLPGDTSLAQARKTAIGAFAALGLPHRRIEEWKYTDLRTALKEALPPALGDEATANRQDFTSGSDAASPVKLRWMTRMAAAFRMAVSSCAASVAKARLQEVASQGVRQSAALAPRLPLTKWNWSGCRTVIVWPVSIHHRLSRALRADSTRA